MILRKQDNNPRRVCAGTDIHRDNDCRYLTILVVALP